MAESDRQIEDEDQEISLPDINITNYRQAKKTWNLERIKEQLSKQAVQSQKINPLVLKEAQSLFRDLDHSLQI